MDPALQELLEGAPEEEVEAIIRLHQQGLAPSRVRLVAQFGDIATCRLRRGAIHTVREDETVASLKAPRLLAPDVAIPFPLAERAGEDGILSTDQRRPDSLRATAWLGEM